MRASSSSSAMASARISCSVSVSKDRISFWVAARARRRRQPDIKPSPQATLHVREVAIREHDRILRRLNRKERRERRESRKEERGLALAARSLLRPGKLAQLKPSVHGHD